jgi:hypothetical protein
MDSASAARPRDTDRAPLVHVGYHKAASTWLQRSVFGAPGGACAPVLTLHESIDLFVRPHALEWNAEAVRVRIDPPIAKALADGQVPVLSNEEFSGNPHAGGFGSVEIAERLARCIPAARILFVVRRQPDAIVSTYKQFVRRGGTLSPRQYFDTDASHFRFRRFRLGHWEYDRLVSRYVELFGASRVLVLPIELLRHDRAEFLDTLGRFCGAGAALQAIGPGSEHRSHSALATSLQRRLNRVLLRDDVNPTAPIRFWRLERWIGALDRVMLARMSGRQDRALAARVEGLCEGRFEESNARLAMLAGCELGRFGYAMATARS